MTSRPELGNTVARVNVDQGYIDHQVAGRRSDVEVRPKLTSIDVHGLLFGTGQVDVTGVVSVFDALSQNRVGHLDDQAVQEHVGEQEGGGMAEDSGEHGPRQTERVG